MAEDLSVLVAHAQFDSDLPPRVAKACARAVKWVADLSTWKILDVELTKETAVTPEGTPSSSDSRSTESPGPGV